MRLFLFYYNKKVPTEQTDENKLFDFRYLFQGLNDKIKMARSMLMIKFIQ